jgi:hypothetical protein
MRQYLASFVRNAASSAALLVALACLLVPVGSGYCEQRPAPEKPLTAPSNACSQIHASLRHLAQAERDQAFALDLYSHGGELPTADARFHRLPWTWLSAPTPRAAMVETSYHRLRETMRDLREILRRVHASRFAGDPQVGECLELGYDAVFKADKVSSDVERVLIIARSQPST